MFLDVVKRAWEGRGWNGGKMEWWMVSHLSLSVVTSRL
jgi:hypothetical protein